MNFLVAGLAILLVTASRCNICIVIASDQAGITIGVPEIGQPPAPRSRVSSDADAAASPTAATNQGDHASAEIADVQDFSSLGRLSADSSQAGTDVRTLSVEPSSVPLLPADRPAWIGSPPDLTSKQHRVFVGSSPESSVESAEQSLDASMEAALKDYVNLHVLMKKGAAEILPLTADYARKNLLEDSEGYLAELKTSQGPMFQKWVVLLVSPEQREQILVWHREAMQRQRLGGIGAALLLLLGGTGTAHLILSRSKNRYAVMPQPADLPPASPVIVKRSGGFLRTVALTTIALALAVPTIWFMKSLKTPVSPRERVSVEVRQPSERSIRFLKHRMSHDIRWKIQERD